MTQDELLNVLARSHADLLAVLDGFSADEFSQLEAGYWTPKEILAHIAVWNDVCSSYLEELDQGRPISLHQETTQEINARTWERDRHLSASQVRAQETASFQQVLDHVRQLDEDLLNRELRGPWPEITESMPLYKVIGIDTYEHYQQHNQDIDAWQQGKGGA